MARCEKCNGCRSQWDVNSPCPFCGPRQGETVDPRDILLDLEGKDLKKIAEEAIEVKNFKIQQALRELIYILSLTEYGDSGNIDPGYLYCNRRPHLMDNWYDFKKKWHGTIDGVPKYNPKHDERILMNDDENGD